MPKKPTYAPVTNKTKRCPKCLTSWQGTKIPDDVKHHYGNHTHFSKLIGIELPSVYDGIHHWKCPKCGEEFPRWMEDGKGNATKRMFPD